MATPSRHQGDLFVTGSLQANTNIPSALSISNSHIAVDAAIAYTKIKGMVRKTFAEESGLTVTVQSWVIHVALGTTGNIVKFAAGFVTAGTGTTEDTTVELHKNGANILTGHISLVSADSDLDVVDGVIGTAPYVIGDVFEVKVTVVAAGDGNAGEGFFCELLTEEDAQ